MKPTQEPGTEAAKRPNNQAIANSTWSPRAKTIIELAQDYRVGRSTVYRLIEDGQLRAAKIGRATRILAEDEAAFVRNLPSLHNR